MKRYRPPRKTALLLLIILGLAGISSVALVFGSFLFPPPAPITTSPTVTLTTPPVVTTTRPPVTNPPKIVGKSIPPGYVMGNPVDNQLLTGLTAASLDTAQERVALRFTAKSTGEVGALTINALGPPGQPRLRIGLQEDSLGVPRGEWLGGGGSGVAQVPQERGFLTVSLDRPVRILAGQVYEIVIEVADASLPGSVSILAYPGNGMAQPFNAEDPDLLSPDDQMNVLSFDGHRWREENMWPIFVVQHTDGHREGQPYSLIAPWVVHDGVYVGQTLIPASTYRVGKVAFLVGSQGAPSDKLYYEIRDAQNAVLARGVFAEASQTTAPKNWIEVSLPQAITLSAGQLYRIALLSPGTDLQNAYHVFGHEFSYDVGITYGGLQHQLTTSHTGGTTWAENADADAVFKLTTA